MFYSNPYQRWDISNCGTGRLRVAINCGIVSVNRDIGGGSTLLLLLLTGTIFSYFCMSSITSVLILAILIAIVLYS